MTFFWKWSHTRMANLNTLSENNEYYTKVESWEAILKFIPTDKIILEPYIILPFQFKLSLIIYQIYNLWIYRYLR